MQKHWYSIIELCQIWKCDREDILHLAQTRELELCYNWIALSNSKSGEASFFFAEYTPYFFSKEKNFPKYFTVTEDVSFREGDLCDELVLGLFTNQDISEAKKSSLNICNVDDSRRNSPLAQLVAVPPDLLIDLEGDELDLPTTKDLTMINPAGYLSAYCLVIIENIFIEKQRVFIALDKLLITHNERIRFEKHNEISNHQPSNKELLNKKMETHRSIKEEVPVRDLSETDEVPTLMILASSLFDAAWKDIPSDMKKPTQKQLEHYIKTRQGITNKADIKALMRISKPDNVDFGGKQKPELTEWKPKNERK